MNKTNNYYSDRANEFIEQTIELNFASICDVFLSSLTTGKKIMDLGFGSGRDSLYFDKLGYEVVSVDYCHEFIVHGKEILDNEVVFGDMLNLNYNLEFDGIFAAASMLHQTSDDLPLVFKNCSDALKDDGVLYCSFKYGDFEGYLNGRYFTFMTEDKLDELIPCELIKKKVYITTDVRIGKENEQWLNALYIKKKS